MKQQNRLSLASRLGKSQIYPAVVYAHYKKQAADRVLSTAAAAGTASVRVIADKNSTDPCKTTENAEGPVDPRINPARSAPLGRPQRSLSSISSAQ